MSKSLTATDLASFARNGDDDPLIDAFIRSTFQQYRDQEPTAAGAPS